MTIDPDLLAKGKELKLHKSQVVCWFGTAASNKPGSFIVHGLVEGVLHAERVEMDGVEHIKGTINARLISARKELEF